MKRLPFLAFLVLAVSAAQSLAAQSPAARSPAAVTFLEYTLRIDSSDLSGYEVTIRIHHPSPHFRLAMATHPEYDDRFWRYIRNFRADAPATFRREDSAVWAISATGDQAGDIVRIRYRVELPPPGLLHFSHRPFLRSTGGLVGDLHSFMYLVEEPQAACLLTLQLPVGWQAATGLDLPPPPAKDAPPPVIAIIDPMNGDAHWIKEFVAHSAAELLDAPILVGRLRTWDFKESGIPHQVVYLPATPGPVDSTGPLAGRLPGIPDGLAGIPDIVRATEDIFHGFPYHRYIFLLEDGCEGALEHGNSVTIGASKTLIASARSYLCEEIAHEYFHTWNLLAIRPAPYAGLTFGPQPQSPGLWFSEGFTMLYADLICRRAHLPAEDPTRIDHLVSLITRYYRDTGNVVLSPTRVSLASNRQPGPLGDYEASTHLQGELLGACLDMLIRDATDGRNNLDDLMREMYRRCAGGHGVTDRDVGEAVTTICGRDAARSFFEDYITDGKPVDFPAWLGLLGLRFEHDEQPATDAQGQPLPDLRVYPWVRRDDTSIRIGVTNPRSCWALAGLHTGDVVASVNGRPVQTREDFQAALRGVRVGDALAVVTHNGRKRILRTVRLTGYNIPVIHITPDPAATPKQQRLLAQWMRGT